MLSFTINPSERRIFWLVTMIAALVACAGLVTGSTLMLPEQMVQGWMRLSSLVPAMRPP